MNARTRAGSVSSVLMSVLVILLLGSCGTPSPAPFHSRSVASGQSDPVVLWWSRYAHELRNVTHVVNDVWVGTEGENPNKNVAKHRDAWVMRGVLPLDWAGGVVYADQGHDELLRKWSSAISNGHLGIAIDEFGTTQDERKGVLIKALRNLRQRHPDAFIAVWHAGLLDRETATAYRDAADLVMLETYVDDSWLLDLRLGFRIQNARRFGLQSIAVPTIAISSHQFAQTPEAIQAQIEWFHNNASDFRGIAVYASGPDRSLVEYADTAIGKVILGTE